MALSTSKIRLPRQVVTEIINKAKDTSVIAALSPSEPQSFVDVEHMIFQPSAEAEVVAEGSKKGVYEQKDFVPVVGKRVKVVTTTRVTDELQWADEDDQLQIVSSIMADQREAMGRAIDYVILHAINPKSGGALSGYTALTAGANSVTTTGKPIDDIDALTDSLIEYTVNGFAMSRAFASSLRKLRNGDGVRMYPDIPLSLNIGSLDGIPAAVSGTVNGTLATTPTKVMAIMGDFSLIKWGYVRDIWTEVIEYGDPDQTGVDLKANNQVAFRTEAMLGYALLDAKGFSVLKEASK